MNQVLTVAAGPTKTFDRVKTEMADAILGELGFGNLSSVEVNHRGAEVLAMLQCIRDNVRTLFGVPDTHEIGILPGGARFHFLAAIKNMQAALGKDMRVLYANTGLWAESAIAEVAPLFGADMRTVGKAAFLNTGEIPENLFADVNVAHFTSNESADGISWPWQANLKVPTIVDFSSDGGMYPINDWTNIALAYGGTQKIFTVAGCSLVIVRKNLLREVVDIPSPLNYAKQLSGRGHGGLVNTVSVPVLHGIDIAVEQILDMGGLQAQQHLSKVRSQMIYDMIDTHGIFKPIASKHRRSRTTITFQVPASLHTEFILHMGNRGIVGVEGHPAVFEKYGGPICRVSFFAAHSVEDAERVATAMDSFARRHST